MNTVTIEESLIEAFKNIYDPEIGINIYDLGLIYNIEPTDNKGCDVTMTLTSAFCPVADALVDEVRCATNKYYEGSVNINLTFEPQWSMESLSEEARLQLGYDQLSTNLNNPEGKTMEKTQLK